MPLYLPNSQHIMRDMYSYPFPEVREILDAAEIPADFMRNTLPIETAAGYLAAYGFDPELALPVRREDSSLDLDELHRPVIERISARNNVCLPGLDTFANTYPVPGSSPAMFHLLAEWQAKGKLNTIAVLDGEYEGYAAYSETLNIPVTRYPDLAQDPRPGEMWFVTNPSARDGNWIDPKCWEEFVSSGHQIVYDAAYVGLTVDGMVDVSSPNIQAVLTSPSKIFGVVRSPNHSDISSEANTTAWVLPNCSKTTNVMYPACTRPNKLATASCFCNFL